MLTHVVGSQIAKLTGTPDEPTEQYRNSAIKMLIPSHTCVNRSKKVSATSGVTKMYHQSVPVQPNYSPASNTAPSGISQTSVLGQWNMEFTPLFAVLSITVVINTLAAFVSKASRFNEVD